MADGRMKLLAQGFTEQTIDELRQIAVPSHMALAEYIQDELLPETRERYNEVYREMYNTDMASIDHYMPIKIQGAALAGREDFTLASAQTPRQQGGQHACSARAGALPIDLTRGLYDVVWENARDMEQWAAYAPVRRDHNLHYLTRQTTFCHSITIFLFRGPYFCRRNAKTT